MNERRVAVDFAEHMPWARAEFARMRLWMACECGWNAMGDVEGRTWYGHIRDVSRRETAAAKATR